MIMAITDLGYIRWFILFSLKVVHLIADNTAIGVPTSTRLLVFFPRNENRPAVCAVYASDNV